MWQNSRSGHWVTSLVMDHSHETKSWSTTQLRFCWKFCKRINRYVKHFHPFIPFSLFMVLSHWHFDWSPWFATQISFLRNIVWLMSNLCRNKNPAPPADKVKLMLPALSQFLCHFDVQILSEYSFSIDTFDQQFEKKASFWGRRERKEACICHWTDRICVFFFSFKQLMPLGQ